MKGFRRVFCFMVVTWALTTFPLIYPLQAIPSVAVDPDSSEEAIQEPLEKAERALENNEFKEAIAIYKQILREYPETLFRGRIYRRLGQSYLMNEDPASAVTFFEKLLEEFPDFPDLESALHELAESYFQIGNLEGASMALERERNLAQDAEVKRYLTDRLVEILLEKGDRIRAIENLLQVEDWVVEEEKPDLQNRVFQIIQRCNLEELTNLLKRHPTSFPGDLVLLRLADLQEADGLLFEAERDLRRFLDLFPQHPDQVQVESELTAIKEQLLQHRFLIGVLLPMSERFQPFTEQVLRGIRLAMDRFEPPVLLGRAERFIGLVIRDTEREEAQLASTIDDLIRAYHVVAIIGPLLSADLGPVVARAKRYPIPVITPSATTPVLPESEGYLFRNALTLEAQGRFMAEYAMMELGLERFCILYPQDAYGATLMRVFRETVIQQDGEIIDVSAYPPQANDFGPQIRRLISVDLSRYGMLETVPGPRGEIQQYIPGFDAIYLPGDYDRIGLIAAQLAFHDINEVVLLGSNGWHSKDLLRIGGRYIEGGAFVDGFFPESTEPLVQEFVSAFRYRYGEEPALLVAQAYDSTMLILRALETGAVTGEEIRNYLEQLDDFPGVSGRIHSEPEGELVRPLYVIEIQDGAFVQVN